ncbi:uncharacterized protein [Phaseolus vulgaris]|uniref:uncharacterized protein n=1 Tax=Phaseolus vulgaris TaxID=3885 RepID=UPI0035C9810A
MYLHEVAKIRNTSKQILYLRNGDAILTEQEAIQTHFLHYYHNLFNGNTPSFNFNLISKTISHLVNDANNVVLTHLATFKEVELVFNLSPSSAPGPDCFEGISIKLTSLSFLRTCLMMHFQFFKENSMTSNFNSSFLILIPKGDGAEYVGNCRPVLSNFKFKIITKMLAYKISVISDIHISPHQKRLSLRQEHLRLKAFDTLKWEFILQVLPIVHWLEIPHHLHNKLEAKDPLVNVKDYIHLMKHDEETTHIGTLMEEFWELLMNKFPLSFLASSSTFSI